MAGGAWSPIMEGRVDLERYGTALRRVLNAVTVAQGLWMRRPGTRMVAPVDDHSKLTKLVPFEFNAEDANMLAFSDQRMRVLSEDGPLIRTPVNITAIDGNEFTAAGHDTAVGDSVYLSGFDEASPLNFAIVKITAVAGDDVTFEPPPGYTEPTLTGDETVSRVYAIETPYTHTQARRLRYLQHLNVLYAYNPDHAPRAVGRYGVYDWRCAPLKLQDGPYLNINETATVLTPGSTGNAIIGSGGTASASGVTGGNSAANGVSLDPDTFWESDTDQTGWLQYTFTSGKVITKYVIYLAQSSTGQFSWKDYAPLNFVLEAYTGSAWVELDRQTDYSVWEGGRSVTFSVSNTTARTQYRLRITTLFSAGDIKARIGRLVLIEDPATAPTITFTASATAGINNDQGFQATDVGRIFRVKGSDGWWRWYTIAAVNSTTSIDARSEADALPDTRATREWRLGMWSDTTGWPTCATFFSDRMWVGGSKDAHDKVAYTRPGGYSGEFLNFSPTNPDATVTEDCGGVVTCNSKKAGVIRWIDSDERGLMVGTMNGEWTIRPADQTRALSATNIEARNPTARGSADIEPVRVDAQVLFVPRARRSLREMSFSAADDGYKVPSMSLYSSHFGRRSFGRLASTPEPHGLIWNNRIDGVLLGFTYNKEEGALGWHEHHIGGTDAIVEDIAELTAADGTTDTLWLEVARTIGGQTRRHIEVMMPFWQEGFTHKDHAFFADCGLVYEGGLTDVVYGLWHLEGETVCVVADGAALPLQTVDSGQIELPFKASRIVVGLPYVSEGETLRPNAGASDGTAQGKTKRTHSIVFRLWESQGGQYRRPPTEDTPDPPWEDFVHGRADPELDVAPPLYTGDTRSLDWPPGYDKEGTVSWRQPGHIGLPLNIMAIMPQLVTQDRG